MKIQFEEIENKEWYCNLWRIKLLGLILLCFLPIVIIVDIFWSFNNYILFRIVNIKSLKRKEYINIWSRMKLKKSLYHRIGCVYCAYVNGVNYFAKDISLSYEMLFCPWRNTNSPKVKHYEVFKKWE